MATLLFTDLDGTLLDHDDYSWAGARTTLARIRRDGIPLVPVTSKTRAEVEAVRDRIGLEGPFVVENGGGAFFPGPYRRFCPPEADTAGGLCCLRLGVPYERVRAFVADVRDRVPMRGFGDLTDAEVAELTGLDRASAGRARRREFSEPVVLDDSRDAARLEELAREAGLQTTRGGRFIHLMGAEQHKGKALRAVRDAFARSEPGGSWTTIAAGDSPNDQTMLEAADIAIVIPHDDGPRVDVAGAVVAPRPGSAGWGEAIARTLDDRGRRQDGGAA